MIDIEEPVIGRIRSALDTELGEEKCRVYDTIPSTQVRKFPIVTVVETDNATYKSTRTGSSSEEHARITYDVNVYSNLTNGRKEQCKHIASAVDEAMLSMGFRRMSLQNIPNYMDQSIYRMTGRYTVLAGKDGTLYYA